MFWSEVSVCRFSIKKAVFSIIIFDNITRKTPAPRSLLFSRNAFLQRARSNLRTCSHKTCSENVQQIYRRTSILKYDFNKVPCKGTLLKSHFDMGVLL